MSEKRFRVNDLAKYIYSEIGEYVDEKHTLTPLRNDELCKLLNELNEENQRLKNDCSILVQSNQEYRKENEQLRKENERQNNEIKLLRKKITELMDDLEKIPLSIREMWLE